MSFIQVNLGNDVVEASSVDEGTYPLVVVAVTEKTSKKSGAPMLEIIHEIEGEANASAVYHYLVLPLEDDEPKTIQFKYLNIKRYLTLAGIPFDDTGFNAEDLYGARFDAFLEKEEIEQEDPAAPPAFRNALMVPRLAE